MFRRPWLLTLLAAFVFIATARAEPVRVCIENQIDLPAPAQAALQAELRFLFPRLGLVIKRDPCSKIDGQVTIFLVDRDADAPLDALGRAPVAHGRILPVLEVFADRVAELVDANDLEVLGRALGRVGGHELLHYLEQQSSHNATGLLQTRLAASDLVSSDRRDYVSLIARR